MEYTNTEIKRRIDEHIHNQKYRDIMRMRLVDGLTYERIAEAVEMSPRQIFNIVRRCYNSIYPDTVFTEICFS